MKTYTKIATVKAKIFEPGDEDGISPVGDYPYVETLENKRLYGKFGKHYLCIGIMGERWLVEKGIFESTYKEVK